MRGDILGRGVCRAFAAMVVLLVVAICGSMSNAQTPSPDDTLRAFHIAEQHIRDWSVPSEAGAADAQSGAPKAVGACITLKLRGEVIGRGTAWSESIAGPEAFSSRVLALAIRGAMQQAEPKLGVANDAMRDQAIKLVTPDILISVELAGPLSAAEFDTWEEAETSLRPGLDGVAVRIAAGKQGGAPGPLHAIFPSQMMLSNMLPHRAMGATTAAALGDGGGAGALDDPKKLRSVSGVRMYRFRVGQVAQSSDSGPPNLLYRGQRLLAASEPLTLVQMQGILRRAATGMANHLTARAKTWVAPRSADPKLSYPEGDARTKPFPAPRFARAVSQQGPDEWADDVEHAIVLLALRRFDEYRGTAEFKPFIDKTLVGMYLRHPDNSDYSPQDVPIMVEIEFMAIGTTPAGVGFRAMYLAKHPVMDSGQAGIQDVRNAEMTSQQMEDCVLPVFASMKEGTLVSAMPSLGWGALEVASARAHERQIKQKMGDMGVKFRPVPKESDDIPASIALRRMRDQCWSHQLSITSVGEDAMDMAGGIVFTGGLGDGKSGGNPYPTWQCARPLAFIATMLRDPRLTEPKDRTLQIVNLMQAMRFLRQLQVDEASAWMYPDPKLAIGGIRASTWDNSLPVDATSMTLLCVVEMLKSLDELAKAPAAVEGVEAAPGLGGSGKK